ncbi:MAG: hypothetical protein HRT90_07235 [Candidatus Margulisbacteria bacterium]|nr:hypothetical protein [Candidatus Margulisiibacteriota bacterium]
MNTLNYTLCKIVSAKVVKIPSKLFLYRTHLYWGEYIEGKGRKLIPHGEGKYKFGPFDRQHEIRGVWNYGSPSGNMRIIYAEAGVNYSGFVKQVYGDDNEIMYSRDGLGELTLNDSEQMHEKRVIFGLWDGNRLKKKAQIECFRRPTSKLPIWTYMGFVNDKFEHHGDGKLFINLSSNPYTVVGKWENGIVVGDVEISYDSGASYNGQVNPLYYPHGRGTSKYKKGEEKFGIFSYGQLQT